MLARAELPLKIYRKHVGTRLISLLAEISEERHTKHATRQCLCARSSAG